MVGHVSHLDIMLDESHLQNSSGAMNFLPGCGGSRGVRSLFRGRVFQRRITGRIGMRTCLYAKY
jgi:hypothetical protein